LGGQRGGASGNSVKELKSIIRVWKTSRKRGGEIGKRRQQKKWWGLRTLSPEFGWLMGVWGRKSCLGPSPVEGSGKKFLQSRQETRKVR